MMTNILISAHEPEDEGAAKKQMSSDLALLGAALDDFLSGEVRNGLITPFKLTLIVQARTLQALVERSARDVVDTAVTSRN